MGEEKKSDERPTWDEYFANMIDLIGERATCDRGKSGALLVKDKKIVATGYVGAPARLPHCSEAGHLMKKSLDIKGNTKENCIRTTHAEMNAIVQAALHGVSTKGATMYCKMEPCLWCAKLIINAGIKRVVAKKRYHDAEISRQFLKDADVELVVLNDEVESYTNKE